ncbi:shikimate 5-dehydrogenase [Desulfuromonas sp. DDH964]|uniref:shikimate dehydrogenase n=1 Tax=Desulfuromonas sp. DDH964 TaxID=1823759 RepID=UPI00078D065C|nr:shikimate dehydrogenase [Desulfuromonas sp. DDH964]AMV71803.1 shikimate 5-dehydrogenase [Desulfuromonas sp. DDH964]
MKSPLPQTVSGKTRVYGIFGDPVAHSLSPLMQNAAFAAAGIDAIYLPFQVAAPALPAAVAALRALGIGGINVTIPHKEQVLAFLDEVDPLAQRIGAVNTIVNRAGTLVGYNTDGIGLLRSLEADLQFRAAGKRILLLGAGGACRAALAALLGEGAAWIGVANRNPERALQLARELAPLAPGTSIAAFALAAAALAAVWGEVDLVINTSAVGLHGEDFPMPIATLLQPAGRIYDMVYGPRPTPLLAAARAEGRPCADGRGMLVGQGEEAFRLWTGQAPPSGVMRSRLLTESSEI